MSDETGVPFKDHFSASASEYAQARPQYPQALFDWIASVAPAHDLAWDAGCGNGQASRDLATRFDHVHATDPSAAQIAQASAPANVSFAVERGEQCSLADASVDAICVAQALHWFDREAFFAECVRVLRPGGVLVAWGYQDIEVPPVLATANSQLQRDILAYWPPERADIDAAYDGYAWPLDAIRAPVFDLHADWPLSRLLTYFSSYSASKRQRELTGIDPVALHAEAISAAWGDPGALHRVRWPLFVRARRKPSL